MNQFYINDIECFLILWFDKSTIAVLLLPADKYAVKSNGGGYRDRCQDLFAANKAVISIHSRYDRKY